MGRPVHFEIHASAPAAVADFYRSLFGWTIEQWADAEYWLVTTGDESPGVNGGIVPRRGERPAEDQAVNGYVMTITVEDPDATVAAAVAAGGSVALPAEDMPGVGRLAYLKDPDGNLFGVLRGEPSS